MVKVWCTCTNKGDACIYVYARVIRQVSVPRGWHPAPTCIGAGHDVFTRSIEFTLLTNNFSPSNSSERSILEYKRSLFMDREREI